jgi:molybdopterin molybdotransferase
MITVAEAKSIVLANAAISTPMILPIEESMGYVLVNDVVSGLNLPPFIQSSMDGYAIRISEWNLLLPVQDELPAGSFKQIKLEEKSAIKVFTGGPIPEGADIVVQKEWVTVKEGQISIRTEPLEPGANIRIPGSDIAEGAIAISAGTQISNFHIGVMAALGVSAVKVYQKPSVAIVITGNELVLPGNPLLFGQVYESNSYALKASLQKLGIKEIGIFYAKDHLEETAFKLAEALDQYQLVLLTGGVSVGEYDFVAEACRSQQVETLFHGVAQKPGKPLFFGKKDEQLVFGLPGNPVSVLSCFQQYVLPAIQKMSGIQPKAPIMAKLKNSYEKKSALCFFLKGRVENGSVTVLSSQASFQQSSLVEANCWIELDAELNKFEQYSQVKLHLFD